MSDAIQRWNEWFELVGLTKEWRVVKEQFSDEPRRLNWAAILELNRIDAVTKKEVSSDRG